MKVQDIDQWSMPFASNNMKNGLDWIKHKSFNPNLGILIYNLLKSVKDTIPNLPHTCSDLRMLSDTVCQLWAWPYPSLHSPSLPCLRERMQTQLFHWVMVKLNLLYANLLHLHLLVMTLTKSFLIPYVSLSPFSSHIFIISPSLSHWR